MAWLSALGSMAGGAASTAAGAVGSAVGTAGSAIGSAASGAAGGIGAGMGGMASRMMPQQGMGQRVGCDCDPGDVLQQVQRLEHPLVRGLTSR